VRMGRLGNHTAYNSTKERHWLPVSLRFRVLLAGVILFSFLFAAITIGIAQTMRIIDERRGVIPPGPGDWLLVRTVGYAGSDLARIFYSASAPLNHQHSEWCEKWQRRVDLFHPIGRWSPKPGEYIPHVIAFDDVPSYAVEHASLERLLAYQKEGMVGLAFFMGKHFSPPDQSSWFDSPIAALIPVAPADQPPLTGVDAIIRVNDRAFSPAKGFDFSTLRLHSLFRVKTRPGARVAMTARVGGQAYPLLVWWEKNGARVIVWTGCLDEVFNWKSDEYFSSGGKAGGPYFVQKIICFAARRRSA